MIKLAQLGPKKNQDGFFIFRQGENQEELYVHKLTDKLALYSDTWDLTDAEKKQTVTISAKNDYSIQSFRLEMEITTFACRSNCLQCGKRSSCLACDPGFQISSKDIDTQFCCNITKPYAKEDNTCNNFCGTGFYDKSYYCDRCKPECSACLKLDDCYECKVGYYVSNKACLCSFYFLKISLPGRMLGLR